MLKRKAIGLAGLVLAVVSLAYILISGPQYKSRATLIPPPQEGMEGLLSAWMAKMELPSMVLPMAAGSTTAELLVDILESRRLAEMVIGSTGLMEWYKTDSLDDALKELSGKTSFSSLATGMISLSVMDRDPEMAMRIASAYISGLDSLNKDLNYTKAQGTIDIVHGQIEKYRQLLDDSRKQISIFQKEHGIINFAEQIRGAIDVAAALKMKSVIAEIELDILREFATDNAIELRRKELEFENLSLQMVKLMEDDSTTIVFFPLSKMPELSQRYAALERDLQVNEKVYSFLVQRYEESSIERARTTPSIQVVDSPNIPVKRSGLPVWAIVLLSALAGWVWMSIVFAWWGWLTMRDRDAEEETAFNEVIRIAREDISSLRKRLKI